MLYFFLFSNNTNMVSRVGSLKKMCNMQTLYCYQNTRDGPKVRNFALFVMNYYSYL